MFESLLSGERLLQLWLAGFVAAGILVGILTGFFQARKIQPNGFKWKIFRFEIAMAVVSLAVSGTVLGGLNTYLTGSGLIRFNDAPAAWWMIAIEYAAYFVLFDTWFYWLHRWMHKEPVYTWVHKIHHKSTSPNLLTTLSVNPLESFINGGFVPLFLAVATLFVLPIHTATVALITPTNILMGLYVHAGYEFLPRWWNKTWLTKWFITTTFHDQHHKYFNYNFGGYTTIWDRICGTSRKKYEADFEKLADSRSSTRRSTVKRKPT
jgi:sterol desaturase/sphingolipid hydroxylase (fatty acid hydroxylase superfamily)